jgi:malonate transporter
MNIAALLFPDLALIAIGWLINRSGRLPAGFWEGAELLVYYVLFPALLFGSISRAGVSADQAAPMVAVAYSALAVGIALSYSAARVLRADPRQFASGAQCGFRFNSYITLSLAARLGEAPGLALAALIVGFIVPVANIAAVYPLARHAGGSVWGALLRNPLVLATLAGLAAQAVSLKLPEPIDATLLRMGQASLGLGLLCVGAGLKLGAQPGAHPATLRSERLLAAWFTLGKLVAMPLTALLMARVLGLAPLATAMVVMFAAMPTSPASFVLANRMGGDGRFVAMLITVSTVGSALGLPIWLGLL